ncbi:Citreoviridin biosynthesis protein D [Colletotrichum sidae]|uniref:Citreoviridin biosynthesis protein D n=1 Tax=Colletotrichum sidae TaxID=1347389 RepID=A0A4R8T406_9PEZI|nr:Citreoviridin biosynthesis protein D [Colletotrichum sidae]
MARVVFSVALLLVLYLAKTAINDLATANGLFEVIQNTLEDEPVKFTSVKALDGFLTTLVCFFLPIVTGAHPPLTLFSVFMLGQVLGIYSLLLNEGIRAANRSKLISYPSLWGMMGQIITIGVTLPMYYLTWLWTSTIPEAAATSAEAFADAIALDPVHSKVLNIAVTLGGALPSAATALPSPSMISQEWREIALAVWQPFPIWIAVVQGFLATVSKTFNLVPNTTQTPAARIERYRGVYTFALSAVVLTYVGTLGWVYKFSDTPLDLLKAMFRPTWPLDKTPMVSMEAGVLTLLQWDMYCSTLSTWIWITYNAYFRAGVVQVIVDLVKLVGLTPLVGPGGAALVVVWGRDVAVVGAAGQKKKTG